MGFIGPDRYPLMPSFIPETGTSKKAKVRPTLGTDAPAYLVRFTAESKRMPTVVTGFMNMAIESPLQELEHAIPGQVADMRELTQAEQADYADRPLHPLVEYPSNHYSYLARIGIVREDLLK